MKSIKLSIPTPCHENWGEMTVEDRGRFCSTCQTTVLDLSNKRDSELIHLFESQSSTFCARLPLGKLNVPLYSEKMNPNSSINLRALIIGTMMLTSLSSWSAIDHSYLPDIPLIQTIVENTSINTYSPPTDTNDVRIELKDIETGEGIPFVKIILYDKNNLIIAGAQSDFDGNGRLTLTQAQADCAHHILIKSVEYDDQQVNWLDIPIYQILRLELKPIELEYYIVGMVMEAPRKFFNSRDPIERENPSDPPKRK